MSKLTPPLALLCILGLLGCRPPGDPVPDDDDVADDDDVSDDDDVADDDDAGDDDSGDDDDSASVATSQWVINRQGRMVRLEIGIEEDGLNRADVFTFPGMQEFCFDATDRATVVAAFEQYDVDTENLPEVADFFLGDNCGGAGPRWIIILESSIREMQRVAFGDITLKRGFRGFLSEPDAPIGPLLDGADVADLFGQDGTGLENTLLFNELGESWVVGWAGELPAYAAQLHMNGTHTLHTDFGPEGSGFRAAKGDVYVERDADSGAAVIGVAQALAPAGAICISEEGIN